MALESVFLCPLGSYVDNGTCQLCSTGLNNCTACVSPTKCHTCTTGYHLENFICIPDCDLVTNCNSCDSPNHCSPTGCTTGYYTNTTTGQCDTCSLLDSNCLTCDGATGSSVTCNTCTTGYYPNGSSCTSCGDTLSHCTSCTNGTTCTTCELGYHLDPTTATCIPDCSVTNCNTCSSPNYCSDTPDSCSTGYYSDNGGCLSCSTSITGCSECSDGSACTTCRSGYILETNGTCTPTGSVPDCSTYSDPDVCNNCNSGYYLNANACTACNTGIANCSACNYASASATLTCDGCDSGYHLDSSTNTCVMDCNPTGGNCNSCTTPNYCAPTGCATGYYQAGGVCASCATTLPHCSSCTDGTTCTTCETGYHLDPTTNTCVLDCNPAGGNCNSCDSPDHCSPTGCNPGYTTDPATGTCTMNCSVANCASTSSCYGPDQCGTCNSGYYPNPANGQCNACSGLHPDCLTCTDASTCTACGGSSYLNGSTCESCSIVLPGCTACSDSSTCTTCGSGYSLVGDICVPTGTDPNCNVYTSPNICSPTGCSGGYYNDSGNCSACTNGCSDCSDSASCNSCNTGYYLTGSGPGSSCTFCSTVSTGCTACSDSSTCTSCATGYNLIAGTCVPTGDIDNCTAYFAPDQCSTCETGYYLNTNACPACSDTLTTNCLSCTSAGHCTSCATDTILTVGACASCSTAVSNCNACDGTACTGCASGYFLDNGSCPSCSTVSTGCISCANGDACTTCGTGYNLVNGACVPTGSVDNCTAYSAPDECSTCATGYTLNTTSSPNNTCDMNCNPLGGNCLTCDTPDHCSPTGCNTGYFSNNGVCAACASTIPGCTACSSGAICTACDTVNGYVLDGATCRATPAAPANLTIPTAIYNAQTITINWDTSTNATGYILERSCNSSEWNSIYQGASPSASNNLADCEQPVQYRVKAFNTIATIASPYTNSTPQDYAACSGNCTACSAANTCTVCNSGHSLVNGACVVDCANQDSIVGTMQTFTVSNCDSYATPSATNYTPIGCLTDERDGKAYEIRKFADGNCWMADNLAYGGVVDACATRQTFDIDGDETTCTGISKSGSAWGYGDCRSRQGDPGYLYDWQAAVQSGSAHCGSTYQPPQPTQGICPTGWHLPSGSFGGEFAILDVANGGDGNYRTNCTDGACNFFRPGGSFKGSYEGYANYAGILYGHGGFGYWWTSTQGNSDDSRDAFTNATRVSPGIDLLNKRYGFNVRCVRNSADCSANCTSCNTATTCNQCADGYALDGGACVPTGTDPNCTTYSAPEVCSACNAGYNLVDGKCLIDCGDPSNIVGTMQDFTVANCSTYATPVPLGYTAIGCLTDTRDNKVYEVRKFADGNCWMVDNLAYGGDAALGGTDACAAKTTFSGNGSATPTNTFGAGTYGDCRNNPSDYAYGYLYNWQAAIQHASAYYGYDYQPAQPTQGICPTGWHLPSGNTGGEFSLLDQANGGTGIYRSGCTTPSCNFFRPGYSFKGVYAGDSYLNGALNYQGNHAYWWSSTLNYSIVSYSLSVYSSYLNPGDHGGSKSEGFSVRCLKNTVECSANCSSCTSITACNQCTDGYAVSGGACIPTGNIANCATYSAPNVCATCNSGYLKSGSACVSAGSVVTGCTASNGSACTACSGGRYLSSGSCPTCPTGCVTCTNASTCQTCTSGYLKSGNTCAPAANVVTGCTASNGSTCTACSSGRYLSSGSCPTCPTGCATCTNASTCQTCTSGYGLVGNGCRSAAANGANGMNMQDFTTAYCAAFAKPAANGYTLVGTLRDSRDGKYYEIRKFADGKCWMADNLKYGGATDACANKTTFDGEVYHSGSSWGYGDCISNPSNPAYGYLYNWQAAVQSASAYAGANYQPPQPTQGICPTGWHLPTGNNSGEFVILDKANGGTGGYRSGCATAACNFFRPGGNFKGLYAGDSTHYGHISASNNYAYWWSSTQHDYISPNNTGYIMMASNASYSNFLNPTEYYNKRSGISVRCIKN